MKLVDQKGVGTRQDERRRVGFNWKGRVRVQVTFLRKEL